MLMLAGSIVVNEPNWFETSTLPSRITIACGRPVLMVRIALVFGSTRATVPSSWLPTHTLPAPTAIAFGFDPTPPIVATSVSVFGSIRCNESTFGVNVGFVLGLPGPPPWLIRTPAITAAAASATPKAVRISALRSRIVTGRFRPSASCAATTSSPQVA